MRYSITVRMEVCSLQKLLPKRLKRLREENGYLQKYVADKLDIKSNTLSGYENGTRSPDPEMINRIADLYDVTADYLLGRSNHPRLTESEDKKADEEVQELLDIIESLPEDVKKEKKAEILAFAKGLKAGLPNAKD